jgi:hypothetical protein
VAVPGFTLKAVLVAAVRTPAVAASVYPVPVLLMLRVENVATPATALTVAVPDNVPPPGLVPMAIVTEFVAVGTKFPKASSTLTCTAGAIAAPAVTFVGWTVNANVAGFPGVTLKAVLVAEVRAAEFAVSV